MVTSVVEHALIIVVIVSGLPLLLSTLVSFGVSFLQAATQIQEQSIGFLLKISTVGVVLFFGSHFFFSLLLEHMRWSLEAIRFIR